MQEKTACQILACSLLLHLLPERPDLAWIGRVGVCQSARPHTGASSNTSHGCQVWHWHGIETRGVHYTQACPRLFFSNFKMGRHQSSKQWEVVGIDAILLTICNLLNWDGCKFILQDIASVPEGQLSFWRVFWWSFCLFVCFCTHVCVLFSLLVSLLFVGF